MAVVAAACQASQARVPHEMPGCIRCRARCTVGGGERQLVGRRRWLLAAEGSPASWGLMMPPALDVTMGPLGSARGPVAPLLLVLLLATHLATTVNSARRERAAATKHLITGELPGASSQQEATVECMEPAPTHACPR